MSQRHSETNNLIHDCSRCGETLNPDGERIEHTESVYVEADEERNPFTKQVAVALKHTDETKKVRDAIVQDKKITEDEANRAIARGGGFELQFENKSPSGVSLPEKFKSVKKKKVNDPSGNKREIEMIDVVISDDEFEREVEVNPEVAKYNPDVVKVKGEEIEIDRPAFLLVCSGCERENDSVEWRGEPR